MNKETNRISISEELLASKIFLLRDLKIILDHNLAELYGVETRRLKEQVKRNMDRFPDTFMFEISDQEIDLMVSQNAIPSKQILGGSRPFAFTEHGILMLANVLRSGDAVKMNIRIIEVFVKMHKKISNQMSCSINSPK